MLDLVMCSDDRIDEFNKRAAGICRAVAATDNFDAVVVDVCNPRVSISDIVAANLLLVFSEGIVPGHLRISQSVAVNMTRVFIERSGYGSYWLYHNCSAYRADTSSGSLVLNEVLCSEPVSNIVTTETLFVECNPASVDPVGQKRLLLKLRTDHIANDTAVLRSMGNCDIFNIYNFIDRVSGLVINSIINSHFLDCLTTRVFYSNDIANILAHWLSEATGSAIEPSDIRVYEMLITGYTLAEGSVLIVVPGRSPVLTTGDIQEVVLERAYELGPSMFRRHVAYMHSSHTWAMTPVIVDLTKLDHSHVWPEPVSFSAFRMRS